MTANQMTPDQIVRAIRALASAIVESIAVAGTQGAPAGVLYSALMGHGISLDQFNSLISGMERTGHVRRSGHLLFATGMAVQQ